MNNFYGVLIKFLINIEIIFLLVQLYFRCVDQLFLSLYFHQNNSVVHYIMFGIFCFSGIVHTVQFPVTKVLSIMLIIQVNNIKPDMNV